MAGLIERLEHVGDLPALPHAAGRVIAALTNNERDPDEIAQLISVDEALSLAVVRRANSAAFGVPGKEFNVAQAIVRLGEVELRRIVLNAQASPMMIAAGRAFGLRRGSLWRGAIGGAVAAELIAKQQGGIDPQFCYLAALFRDIGKLALDAHFGDEYSANIAKRLAAQDSFAEAERQEFGVDHAQIGAELARRWGLPDRVARAIGFHHAPPPPGVEHDPLFDIVHGADVLCLWAGLGVGDDGLHYRVAEHLRESSEVLRHRRAAEAVTAETWTRVKQIEHELGLGTQQERHTA